MPRIGLFLFSIFCTMGCRAPGFDPLGVTGPTRVPPPPTGAVGYDNSDYYAPIPRPTVGQGASRWPNTNFESPTTTPSNGFVTALPTGANTRPALATNGQTTDNLDWIDPSHPATTLSTNAGLHPSNGPRQPLVSTPPRVRGFQNTNSRRELYIPEELANLQNANNGVRQASTYNNWQPRYDDVRR